MDIINEFQAPKSRGKNARSTPKPHGRTAPGRSLFRFDDDGRLARIRHKAPHEKDNAELAYEEGAAIADELPDERASIIAGALHGLPSMRSMLVLVGGVDKGGRPTFASAVVDVAAYLGEGAR